MTLDQVQAMADAALRRAGACGGQRAPVARSIRAAEAEGTRGIGLGDLPWYCRHLRMGKIVGNAVPVVSHPRPGVVMVQAGGGFAHPAYEAGEADLIAAARGQRVAVMGVAGGYACAVLGYFSDRLARAGLVSTPSPMPRPPWRPGGAVCRSSAPTLGLWRAACRRPPCDRQLIPGHRLCQPRHRRRRGPPHPRPLGA